MKKSINLIFHLHQPFRLRKYHFFNIGNDHYYYDDYINEANIEWLARKCYLPATDMLLRKITQFKSDLKVAMYVSGVMLELLAKYAPEVLESLKKLARTGMVEFLGGTWSYSPSSLINSEAFENQATTHKNTIQEIFGQLPTTFFNTGLLYSDDLGAQLHNLGFKSAVLDGGRQVLGWRSPNMLYSNAVIPEFKLHMRQQEICDSLTYRFTAPENELSRSSNTAFVSRLEKSGPGEQVVNICLNIEIMGRIYNKDTGIFSFMENMLNGIARSETLESTTPSETLKKYPPVSLLSIPQIVSWANEENDLSALSQSELQQEALTKLFDLTPCMLKYAGEELLSDWNKLQCSDFFYKMSSHYYSHAPGAGDETQRTPHEVFVNYMNILSDVILRAERECPSENPQKEIARLKQIIEEQKLKSKKPQPKKKL